MAAAAPVRPLLVIRQATMAQRGAEQLRGAGKAGHCAMQLMR